MLTWGCLSFLAVSSHAAGYSPQVGQLHPDFTLPGIADRAPVYLAPRHIEFELHAANDASGTSKLSAYALYYVCEGAGGTCSFLRQDIPITVIVDK